MGDVARVDETRAVDDDDDDDDDSGQGTTGARRDDWRNVRSMGPCGHPRGIASERSMGDARRVARASMETDTFIYLFHAVQVYHSPEYSI
jgi:hypothetical protein